MSCRATCTTTTPRSRRLRSSRCSRTHIYRLLPHKRVHTALAAKYVNGVQPSRIPATSQPLLRTLARPTSCEVNTASIETAYPELAGVTPEYIREHLLLTGPQCVFHLLECPINIFAKYRPPNRLLAAAACVHACPPKTSLPRELEIVVNDMVAAACPTHMLAVYSNTPSNTPSTTRRKVTLFPTHHLVLAAHCINLPRLPLSTATTSTKTTLPVIPLCLPSPETFALLQTYLYTKHTTSLLMALLPSNNAPDVLSLSRLAMMIHGIWRNACVLGVVDEQLFDTIDKAWDVVVNAMGQARS